MIQKLVNKEKILAWLVQVCGQDNDLGYGAIQLLAELFNLDSTGLPERALLLGFYPQVTSLLKSDSDEYVVAGLGCLTNCVAESAVIAAQFFREMPLVEKVLAIQETSA